MRHPLVARIVIAVWALWLGIAITEPAALGACPMHGTPVATQTSDVADHSAHGAHQDQSQQHSGHQCSCLGACCCAAPTSAPSATVALLSVPDANPPVQIVRRDAPRVQAIAYRLPFANGPPVVA